MGREGNDSIGKFLVDFAKKVQPIDTTGAGDAFFGTVLAYLDGKKFTRETIKHSP